MISTVDRGSWLLDSGFRDSRRSLSASNFGQSRARCLMDLRPSTHAHIAGTAGAARGARSFAKLELRLRFTSREGEVALSWTLVRAGRA